MRSFVDDTFIEVSSGKGGDGCVSFRREKYVPKGGPDGGDGGKGGNVVFIVKNNVKTLTHLKMKRLFRAKNGFPGQGRKKHGQNGADVEIPVPPGTLIKDYESEELIKDLTAPGEKWIFLQGGKGGGGNTHFATSRQQTPRFAQPGQPGTSLKIRVELNIIADIGFVGFPNAGKSSLLDVLTNAHPAIASYAFTTKIPNLGVLTVGDKELILADIPGIIQGAARGAGLGIQFLKHIARTEGLAFLIDLSDQNFLGKFVLLKKELGEFAPLLLAKKRIIIGTKLDLTAGDEELGQLAASLPEEKVLGISSLTRRGIKELVQAFGEMVN